MDSHEEQPLARGVGEVELVPRRQRRVRLGRRVRRQVVVPHEAELDVVAEVALRFLDGFILES